MFYSLWGKKKLYCGPVPHMNRQYLFCKLFRFLEDIREKRMSLPTLTDRKLFYF